MTHAVGGWTLRAFVRVNNVTDRDYVGSVIVGDTNGRFFEPAPGRNVFAGASARRPVLTRRPPSARVAPQGSG